MWIKDSLFCYRELSFHSKYSVSLNMKLLVLSLGRTKMGGGGGGWMPLPIEIFRRCFQDRLLLAYAVFSSCSFILETHFGKVWRQSVAMVTRYGVISNT